MILFSKYLVPKGYTGITVFPFVFLKHRSFKEDKVLINHEKIHLRQQIELLIILFYIFYFFEFLIRFIQYKSWYAAYKNISFEREAYQNQTNLFYLNKRPFWQFLKYFRRNDI